MRRCSACGEDKPNTGFHKDKYTRDGLTTACKACRTRKTTAWNKANVEKYRANKKVWRQKHAKELSERARVTHVETYGITFADYEALLGPQCPICGRDMFRPVVDHDHATGEVRGVICVRCNTGLGMFGDDPDALGNAVTYLASPPARGQVPITAETESRL